MTADGVLWSDYKEIVSRWQSACLCVPRQAKETGKALLALFYWHQHSKAQSSATTSAHFTASDIVHDQEHFLMDTAVQTVVWELVMSKHLREKKYLS